MRGLEAAFDRILDRRLAPAARRPLAVALSGGGDSLALALMADAWARRHGRELLILTVDHRLQAGSASWVEACRATAERLRRPFQALVWNGEKRAAGIPAAAREARHGLLADAAREAKVQVVLMGHTADDVAEARAMRAAGSTTPDPREWAPSPVWPEGRGVFLLRPLLGVRRGALRDWLGARGETWIEDPANEDLRYARARARRSNPPPADPPDEGAIDFTLATVPLDSQGSLVFWRHPLRWATLEEARRFVSLACVCVGGGSRLPSGASVDRLAQAIRTFDDLTATLAGARVAVEGETVHIVREAGEAARGGLAPMALPIGRSVVWDGRYELTAAVEGLEVRRLRGLAARLSSDTRRRLRYLHRGARGSLPVVVDAAGGVACPLLDEVPGVSARSLIGERLAAASGLVERESP